MLRVADYNYSVCEGEEGVSGRGAGGRERAIGGPGHPTSPSGCVGCDGRWQLTLTSAYTFPVFGPWWALSQCNPCPCSSWATGETPPSPSWAVSAFAISSPWHQDRRLLLGDVASSHDEGQFGRWSFPLGSHTRGAQKW